MKLNGRVAIVTGSGQGIGRAIAIKLASEGATVVVNDIVIVNASRVADEIKSQGGTAIALKADVANRAEVQNLAKKTMENFKAIHILVNNAAFYRRTPLLEVTDEEWDITLAIDLKGVFNCIQTVLPHMIKQQYGKIISISSVAAIGHNRSYQAPYAAAKAGVVQLTKVTAREGGAYGINVNSIAPGLIITEMSQTGGTKEELEERMKGLKASSALGRSGSPEDIANLALFLASDDSSYITGQVISCDGGRMDGI